MLSSDVHRYVDPVTQLRNERRAVARGAPGAAESVDLRRLTCVSGPLIALVRTDSTNRSTDGTHYGGYYDYGDAQATNRAEGPAIMETVSFGADHR